MKTLYFDCSMGAAGDMLTAALLELIPDKKDFIEKMNCIGIPGVTVSAEKTVKGGITGTHISVKIHGEEEGEHTHEHHEHDHEHSHHHEHTHNGLHEIEEIVKSLTIDEKVKGDIMAVYALIAQAESVAHGVPVTDIHFHEVGAMDAIADITAVCLLMNEIAPEKVIASPVHVGSGHVCCSHSILPVPTPATAYILRGCPIYSGTIKSELCTPTGAALLRHFVSEFKELPMMRIEAIGYGMGKKDFTTANCIRAMLGETEDGGEDVTELECNIDDMTAEELSFAVQRIFEAGALEVFTVPCTMKKGRPGNVLNIICSIKNREAVLTAVFSHTSTIGVREYPIKRHKLSREIKEINTPYGTVHEKVSQGFGVKKSKYEFDDLSRIAKENKTTLSEVRRITDESK